MHFKFQEWSNWEIGHCWTEEILKWKKPKNRNIQKSELSAYLNKPNNLKKSQLSEKFENLKKSYKPIVQKAGNSKSREIWKISKIPTFENPKIKKTRNLKSPKALKS